MLYSLRRHGNRTQSGLEGRKKIVGMYIKFKCPYRWTHVTPHGLRCSDMQGLQLSALSPWWAVRHEWGLPSFLLLVQYAALQVSVRLESAKASLILKIEPCQQVVSTAVPENSVRVRRRAHPAVWMERKICIRLRETAKGRWRCRSNVCAELWSVKQMIQLQNSQRHKLSHIGSHFKLI